MTLQCLHVSHRSQVQDSTSKQIINILSIGRDDYLYQLEDSLYSEKSILWSKHDVEINSQVPIPDHQEVKVGVNVYDASKPEFSFPEGFAPKSFVYQIRVTTRNQTLINGIQVTLTNTPQPQHNEYVCILEAPSSPSRWEANHIPVFSFSQIEASRFKHHDRVVKIAMKCSTITSYLVIAGE